MADLSGVKNSISAGNGDDVERDQCRGIYVGTSGTLVYVSATGSTVTKTNVAAGITHPWQATKIVSSGTTAEDIWMEY